MKIVLLTIVLSVGCGGESPAVPVVEVERAENTGQVRSFVAVNHEVEQGGTLVFQISPQWMPPATQNPTIYVFDKHYKPNSEGTVFVGVGLDTEPGKYIATFNENGLRSGWDYEEIEILPGSFEKTRTSWYTERPTARTDRQKREIDRVFENAMRTDGSVDLTGGFNYVFPLYQKTVLDPFGFIYKNNPYRKHEGVDLKASVGMAVLAANSGKVVMVAKNFSREGNMLIISHGLGIFSIYMHLSKFEVRLGETVKQGQLIALSGRTGVGVREPHLHFGVKIHDVYVDPLEFIRTTNSR